VSVPADAPSETVFCGDLRREPDGRWFFGSTYLGKETCDAVRDTWRRFERWKEGRSVFPARMMSLLAVLGLSSAACIEPEAFEFPPTDVVYEGDLIRIRAAPGLEPCGGTGRSMEAMLSLLITETGLGGLESPLEVYWLRGDDVQELCKADSEIVGCSLSTTEAVTSRMPEEHEVVHAYFERKGAPFRYSFFDEGMATVYGTGTHVPAPQTPLEESILFDRRMPGVHYPRAGHFVSFLIEEFGPQTTAAFVAQSSSVTSESLPVDFEAHFGEPLERVIEAYTTEMPESCAGRGWQRFSACEQEPTEWGSTFTWEVNVGAGCEDEVSLGGSGGAVRERFIYETDEDVVVQVQGVGIVDHRPRVELMRCGGGCEEEFSYTHDLEENGVLFGLPLDAGKYLVTSEFESGAPIEPSGISIRRDP